MQGIRFAYLMKEHFQVAPCDEESLIPSLASMLPEDAPHESEMYETEHKAVGGVKMGMRFGKLLLGRFATEDPSPQPVLSNEDIELHVCNQVITAVLK